MSHLIDRTVGPHDIVALIGYYPNEPAFDYFVISHYAGPWKRPVIFLMNPPRAEIQAQFARTRVWMVGHSAISETDRLLPGWKVAAVRGIGRKNFVWLLNSPDMEPK